MNFDSLDNAKTIDHRFNGGKGRGDLSPGTMLGQYCIIRLLGRGGMGEVYEVEHEVLRRRYALKLIPDELASQRGFLERFKREAQVMAHLDHPHIVKVDEFGETGGKYWLRMELVEGIRAKGEKITTLAELAASGKGKVEQRLLARVLGQVLEGLSYAHGKGTVHRDLKPANILLSGNNLASIEAKISDFGLVRLVGEEWVRSRAEQSVSLSLSLGDKETVAGADESGISTRSILGTYEYMSPEQKRGEEADARSDLYAVGLMAFRLLTGKGLGMKTPSQIDKNLVPEWDDVVLSTLEEDMSERCWSASEMLAGLKKVGAAISRRARAEIAKPHPSSKSNVVSKKSRKAPSVSPPKHSKSKSWIAPLLTPGLGSKSEPRLESTTSRKRSDDSKLSVTCPNCGEHQYLIPKNPGDYRFRCPNTKYVLGVGKYVFIAVKKNGKVIAR